MATTGKVWSIDNAFTDVTFLAPNSIAVLTGRVLIKLK